MSSQIIKCVAGAGKTAYSINYLSKHGNGLYLAFTNSVVKEIHDRGYLSKTIDALFFSYIIPKFIQAIPIIDDGSKVSYLKKENIPKKFLNIMNIHVEAQTGRITNRKKPTDFSLCTGRDVLLKANGANVQYLKIIFGEKVLRLTDALRNEISQYIILHFPEQLVELIKERFAYVIIDEAQDLSGYKEGLVQLLGEADIETVILGDDNQNIMGGTGTWFESKAPTVSVTKSMRSPESICLWIRENLDIDIWGDDKLSGKYYQIDRNAVKEYDDGVRHLLYHAKSGKDKAIIDSWNGPKSTIKTAKGSTIRQDIVVLGKKLNKKNLYTALTRTRSNVYSTVVPNTG